MKLTPVAERLPVELSLPVFTTKACQGWDSNTQPSAFEAKSLSDCVTAAVETTVLFKLQFLILVTVCSDVTEYM